MAIITSYFSGEDYGLLGPQLAATIIQEHADVDCIVIAVNNEDDKPMLQSALADYFEGQPPIIGFSLLSGREDLFFFAEDLRKNNVETVLGGPQAASDYKGEVGRQNFPHRFQGLFDHFSVALDGPAEQIIPWLQARSRDESALKTPGMMYVDDGGRMIENQPKHWEGNYFNRVKWDNLYIPTGKGLQRHSVQTAQVLQQIGCPHASRSRQLKIDYPAAIAAREGETISVQARGCSFCDVAADKGFCGILDDEVVLNQIRCLPEGPDGRKIPFELINENPLPSLPRLLRRLKAEKLRISQINLIMRADWFLTGKTHLEESLRMVSEMNTRILMASMGFEAFDDKLLRNFNKGYSAQTNINAIKLMRRLKAAFPDRWLYANREGAIHGYIHPTPWDTLETFENTQKIFAIYGLANDILPRHSTPLIIHHASALGDWMRAVEIQEGIRYKRYGSIIGWWDDPQTA
jgi:hypothetical protein